MLETCAPTAVYTAWALSPAAIVMVVLAGIAMLPMMSYFRRRETHRFLRNLSAVVDELQMCRGSVADDWRWCFEGPEAVFDHLRDSGRVGACAIAMVKFMRRVYDLVLHLGPVYAVRIVGGQTPQRDRSGEMDTLL